MTCTYELHVSIYSRHLIGMLNIPRVYTHVLRSDLHVVNSIRHGCQEEDVK